MQSFYHMCVTGGMDAQYQPSPFFFHLRTSGSAWPWGAARRTGAWRTRVMGACGAAGTLRVLTTGRG